MLHSHAPSAPLLPAPSRPHRNGASPVDPRLPMPLHPPRPDSAPAPLGPPPGCVLVHVQRAAQQRHQLVAQLGGLLQRQEEEQKGRRHARVSMHVAHTQTHTASKFTASGCGTRCSAWATVCTACGGHGPTDGWDLKLRAARTRSTCIRLLEPSFSASASPSAALLAAAVAAALAASLAAAASSSPTSTNNSRQALRQYSNSTCAPARQAALGTAAGCVGSHTGWWRGVGWGRKVKERLYWVHTASTYAPGLLRAKVT